MAFVVKVAKVVLNIIYAFLKLFKTQNKIIFLSRQSNQTPLDFKLIIDELKDKNYKIVVLCQRIEAESQLKSKLFEFTINLFKSMYHLATSKVCIIDSYSLPVSILKHKKNLTVIQIWHAMGKLKQSGYQTLGKKDGRNPKMARVLNMHKNYDLVVAGAKSWNFAYCSSFNITEDKLWNIGLPRAAHIYNNYKKIRTKIYKKYPELKNKKIILYSPTFRVSKKSSTEELIKNIDYDNYILIITSHPKHILNIDNPNIYTNSKLKINIYELLTICDYFITDYSSLAVEAAAINKKTYYYLYDYEDYIKTNGLNLDPLKEFPKITFKNGKKLIENLNNNQYDIESFKQFKKKYLPKDFEQATKKLVNYIIENMEQEDKNA